MLFLLAFLSCAKPVPPPPAADAGPECLDVADTVRVPRSVRRDGINESYTVLLTIDETGNVANAAMEGIVREDVGVACTRHWERSRWRPAYAAGEPVQVAGVRVRCTLSVAN